MKYKRLKEDFLHDWSECDGEVWAYLDCVNFPQTKKFIKGLIVKYQGRNFEILQDVLQYRFMQSWNIQNFLILKEVD